MKGQHVKNTTRNRIYRSALQAFVGGAGAQLFVEIANISGAWRGVITAGGVLAVATAQNIAEELGWLKDTRR